MWPGGKQPVKGSLCQVRVTLYHCGQLTSALLGTQESVQTRVNSPHPGVSITPSLSLVEGYSPGKLITQLPSQPRGENEPH